MIENKTNDVHGWRRLFLAAVAGALLGILGTLGFLFLQVRFMRPTANQQAMVHDMGGQVMPFDLSQTRHIFEMTETGGVQQVIANDPKDTSQITLIQQHLQHEALLFTEGDFSDPTSLHGADMPGVKELSRAAEQVKIEYAVLPNGAQITFSSPDFHLVTAIHRWFGAQLSDHGADATYR